ncbi:hypothetical protein CPB84DRAFT_1793725, partial [Gymnopilus junonius]
MLLSPARPSQGATTSSPFIYTSQRNSQAKPSQARPTSPFIPILLRSPLTPPHAYYIRPSPTKGEALLVRFYTPEEGRRSKREERELWNFGTLELWKRVQASPV